MTRDWTAAWWHRRSVRAARPARFGGHKVAVFSASAVILATAGGVLALAMTGQTPVASNGGVALSRTSEGLLTSRTFDRPLPLRDLRDDFSFDGSATPGIGYGSLGPRGLTIGVHVHPNRFEGWFAVTRAFFPSSATYHVQMAKPRGAVDHQGAQGEAVFAVQTGTTKLTGLINYVVVASNSARGETHWTIGYAHGHIADAILQRLASISFPGPVPDVVDVTLTTDGRHRLSVWIGRRLVYRSTALHLDIAAPFQPYLEVQARRIAYTASFHDFWVAAGHSITVSAPARTRLDLVGSHRAIVATATVHDGSAHLTIPPPLSKGRASLVATLNGRRVELGPFDYASGDRFNLSGLPPSGG